MGAAAGAAKGGLALGKTLFGEGQTSEQQQQTFEQLQMRPEDLARLQQQLGQVQAGTQQFGSLAQQLQQAALGGAPQTQQLQGPQFATALDPFAKRLAARGTQSLLAGGAAAGRQAQQQLGGLQPGVARALGLHASQRARLQANPLLMAAAQEQQGRQLGQQQLLLGAQQAENQRRLQQAQAEAAMRQQALGFGGAGLQAQQGLLGMLSQLGQQLGQRQRIAAAEAEGRSGGLLTGVF